MLLSEDEIAKIATSGRGLYDPHWAIREAVRMAGERCAEICEEQMGYEMEEHAADACAAAIRERVKAPGQ